MASFTDAISQFNPYVKQLSVDEMAKVGMFKQQQYDQGVQKVQSYIDNVAGMDVAHNADKAYLQSKLNQLGSNLKYVAAGDFSNQQVISSVGGMATQIIKDENIQNAVSSTASYKKGIAEMDEAKKKGTLGASNAAHFNRKAQEWLSNPEAGQRFNTGYTPYTNVNKKVIDTISKIHSNADFKDIGSVINPDGTVNSAKITDALNRQGYEAVTEGQIRTVLNATLDATDLNQLRLDGELNLQGYDKDALARVATVDYDKSKRTYLSQLQQASKDLLITNDTNKQRQLNESIDYYKRALGYDGQKGALDESYENTLASISKDPDTARGLIHTKNYIDQIANGFAWAHVKSEIVASPLKDVYFKTKNLELDYIQRNDTVKDQAIKNLISQGHLEVARSAEQRAIDKDKVRPPLFIGSGDQVTDNLESYKNFNNATSKLDGDNAGILTEIAKSKSSITTKVDPKDIREAIENGTFKPETDAERQWVNTYKKNQNTIANQKAMIDELENQSAKEITGGLNQKQVLDEELRSAGNLTIGGVQFSSKEVFNFLKKEKQVASSPDGRGVSKVTLEIDPNEELTPREKLLYSKMGTRYTNQNTNSTGNATMDNYLHKIKGSIVKNRNFTDQVNILTAQKLAPYSGTFKTESAAVIHKDENAEKQFVSALTNVIEADIEQRVAGPQYDPATALKLLTSKASKDLEQQVVRKGDEYYIKLTDKTEPGNMQLIKVPANVISDSPSLGASFLNVDTDLAQVLLSGNGSTNAFNDYKHARYQQNGYVTLPINVDLVRQSGNLYPVFRVQTKNGPLKYTGKSPVSSVNDFETWLSGSTDQSMLNQIRLLEPNIDKLIK
jgi:hypothetical protein